MTGQHLAVGPDWQAGYDAAMTRCRTILEAGRRLGVIEAAIAMLEVDLDVETAIMVMRKASPLPEAEREVVDVPN